MTKITAIAKREAETDGLGNIEKVLIKGDLSPLSDEERTSYYMKVCDSIKLNPYTKPFDYIRLNGKLTLYALKGATDQLRKINGVSIGPPEIQEIGGNFVVTVTATDSTGRQDSDVGVVSKSDMGGNFGNALMKAITKAKRRVTLSICGLGMLDETEVETIPGAQHVAPRSKPLELTSGSDTGHLRKQITDLCSELNRAGDSIAWTQATLNSFCNDYFDDGEGFAALVDNQLQTLKEELEMRLASVQEGEAAEDTEVF